MQPMDELQIKHDNLKMISKIYSKKMVKREATPTGSNFFKCRICNCSCKNNTNATENVNRRGNNTVSITTTTTANTNVAWVTNVIDVMSAMPAVANLFDVSVTPER